MRIIRQDAFGGPEVLALTTAERPVPMGTEVLVRVQAAGVNPVDWKTRAGRGVLRSLPCTVGWDVAGVVEATGPGVTRFGVGDEVFGMPWFPRQAAAYAEFVVAPSRHFARRLPSLDVLQAAGLPLAGLTAWQALVDTAQLRPGQRVLIQAAGGGVGHLAVQIARARGAHVVAVASGPKRDAVLALGADEILDHTRQDLAEAGDLDVAFDLVGTGSATAALRLLRPGGVLVTIAGGPEPGAVQEAAGRGIRWAPLLVEPDHAGLEALAALAEAGRLRVTVAAAFPLAEAAAAHELGERGHTAGKIVLRVTDG